MNDGTVKLDEQHNTLVTWAKNEMRKLGIASFMEPSQIEQFLQQNIMHTPAEIEYAFSELLDMTSHKTKEFLQNLLSRKSKVNKIKEQQKLLLEKAKKDRENKRKEKRKAFKRSKREM